MKPSIQQVNELKSILENMRTPGALDTHPWTNSLVVQEEVSNDSSLGGKSPGYNLVTALSRLFCKMIPSTPPRSGKRLDTRWCQFGMLAAQYFAPFMFGGVYPTSLRDAWGRMDQDILLFVFGKNVDALNEEKTKQYRLFLEDEEPAPYSTLSDWHIKGLERLFELFINQEQFLSHQQSRPSPILVPTGRDGVAGKESNPTPVLPDPSQKQSSPGKSRRLIAAVAIILVLILLGGASLKAWRIYQKVQIVRNDIQELEAVARGPIDLDTIQAVGGLLSGTHADVDALSVEVRPLIGATHFLDWVPVVGGDLSMSKQLLDVAVGFTAAADETYQGIQPVLGLLNGQKANANLSELSTSLLNIQPQLTSAKNSLDEAVSARAGINVEQLSPTLSDLVLNKLDPYLQALGDGLTVLLAAPDLLGASENGPQTYMILLQNEDELRATGGFITGVGTVVIKDGKIISYEFEDSYNVDDLTKPYPVAPQPLRDYMDIQSLHLRDSNWSPDFPTSAALAEYLYAYTRFHGVDGVIAIDQHFLVVLLGVLGPLDVVDAPYPITAENVIGYIRSQRMVYNVSGQGLSVRKTFFQDIGESILNKLQSGSNLPVQDLQKVILTALNERHLLVQLDNRAMASILANQGWDGALKPGGNDYLMVVDSNVGYNKANPMIEEAYSYTVDLSNILSPVGNLTITLKNNASSGNPCLQWNDKTRSQGEELYKDLMDRCYWDYLRVYKPAGTILAGATPHAVPGFMMMLAQPVPAQVDTLDEGLAGIQGYGTLLVVPGGTSVETGFSFTLPSLVLMPTSTNSMIYQLRVQKQPSSLAIPIKLVVRLPQDAVVISSSPEGEFTSGEWRLTTTLRKDLEIRIEFKNP